MPFASSAIGEIGRHAGGKSKSGKSTWITLEEFSDDDDEDEVLEDLRLLSELPIFCKRLPILFAMQSPASLEAGEFRLGPFGVCPNAPGCAAIGRSAKKEVLALADAEDDPVLAIKAQ